MNKRLNELRLDAGIAQLKDDPRLVVIDCEGNVIDPLIGLEKFAELVLVEVYVYILNATLDDQPWPDFATVKRHFFGVE